MTEPVMIKAEPATLQVRTVAMASASPEAHQLVVGQDVTQRTVEYHAACSCGRWSASHHTDRARLESLHASHVEKKRASDG